MRILPIPVILHFDDSFTTSLLILSRCFCKLIRIVPKSLLKGWVYFSGILQQHRALLIDGMI